MSDRIQDAESGDIDGNTPLEPFYNTVLSRALVEGIKWSEMKDFKEGGSLYFSISESGESKAIYAKDFQAQIEALS